MKTGLYFLGIIMISLSSCKSDDDSDGDSIIGKWILESTTEQDYNQNVGIPQIGCDGNATMLTFDTETRVNVNSMVVVQQGDKLCVTGGSEEVTNNTITLIEGTFPPPKDIFTYSLRDGKLILIDAASNSFVFIKDN